MNINEAIKILSIASGHYKGTREEHLKIDEALKLIEDYVEKNKEKQ